MKEFHPNDDERIERTVREVTNIIGPAGLGDLLANGDPEMGIYGFEEGTEYREELNEWRRTDESDIEPICDLIAREGDIIGDLEQFVVGMELGKIGREAEHGFDRVKRVERAMNGLPGWLAEDLLYQAIDHAEGYTFDQPSDYDDLLGLRQIEAEWFGQGQNRQERKRLWDEALKFSRYRVEIRYNEGQKYIDRGWYQSTSTAHNRALRRAMRESDYGEAEFVFENAEQTVEELYMPETDPLDDIEEFVYRW